MKKHVWRTTELAYLRNNPHKTDRELAEDLGFSYIQVKRARHRYKIIKGSHANQRGNPNGNIQNLKPRGGFKADRIAA